MILKTLRLFIVLLLSQSIYAQQTVLTLDTSIVILENGNVLPKAWTGGLDCPMYSSIDLNYDGINDLFVFDHKTNRVLTFINTNQQGVSYHYAPEYAELFPIMQDWAKLYDYNCDGNADIFTHGYGAITCYRNNGTTPISFTLITSQINGWYHFGSAFFLNPIFVSAINAPAFTDMEGDGDMDILSLPIGGGYIEFNKNYSMDSIGQCSGFRFYNIRTCWAYFNLNLQNNIAVLPPVSISSGICPAYSATYPRFANLKSFEDTLRHGGGVQEMIDMEGDGDKDILIGDIVGKTLLYVENGATSDSAYAISQDSLFPSYNVPAYMENIAAPYVLDVNNDGKKDLLVSNYNADAFQGAGENYYNTLYYENVSTQPNGHTFQYVKNSFLTEEMVDVGSGSHPAFFDVDADGKKDLLIGNEFFYFTGGTKIGRISYYHNSGTLQVPLYELVTHDFAGLAANNFAGVSPTFGDIDNDGDDDMILGNYNSSITLYRNNGGPGNPAIFVLDSINYQGISIGGNGQQSLPQLYDLDKDGLLDLIIGKRTGVLSYYKNTGTATNPVFTFVTPNLGGVDVHDPSSLLGYSVPLFYDSAGVTQLLVGTYKGFIAHYTNIDNNLSGTFTLVTTSYLNIYEPLNSSPAMSDINGDGLLDFIVGNLAGGVRCYKRSIVSSIESSAADPLFLLYPNPASTSLMLEFSSYHSRIITVNDVLGNTMLIKNNNDRKSVIDISKLSPGSYLVKVWSHGKTISRKFVKISDD